MSTSYVTYFGRQKACLISTSNRLDYNDARLWSKEIAQRKERYANENANEKKDRTTKDAKNMLKYTIVSSFYNIMQ